MSSENHRHELITELADAITEITRRYGGETEATVRRGTPTTISYQDDLEDGDSIELVVAISSDLQEDLTPKDTFGGVTERARTDRSSKEHLDTTGAITRGDEISMETFANSWTVARSPAELERFLERMHKRRD